MTSQTWYSLPVDQVLHSMPYLSGMALVFLTPLHTLTKHMVLHSPPSLSAVGLIMPGMHTVTQAATANNGEYPACAAMTTGYIFRIENAGTVAFLQSVGTTGCLTTLSVTTHKQAKEKWSLRRFVRNLAPNLILGAVLDRVLQWSRMNFGLGVLLALVLARLLNVLVLRRLMVPDWHGASEPGVKGDLVVLLSEDRWIRIQGLVDDLKAVTSGAWLRKPRPWEAALLTLSNLIVYATVGVMAVSGAHAADAVYIITLSLLQLVLIGWHDSLADSMVINDREVRVERMEKYERRTVMVDELIRETGRDDWAVGLGMIVPEKEKLRRVVL